MSDPITIKNLRKTIDKLDADLVAAPMRNLMNRASESVRTTASENAPVGISGDLRKSIATEVDSARVPLWAKVGTNQFYAPYVELGTKPHWPPKGGTLQTWAVRKGVDPEWIRWKIARFGTKPQPYLKPALEGNRSRIDRLIGIAASEIEASANGGD